MDEAGETAIVVIAGSRYLSLKTAAQILARSRQWLRYRFDMPGHPPFRWVGGRLLLPEAEFMAWLQGDLRNPRPPIQRSGGEVFRG
jgi:hypothetical protein